MNDFQEQAKNWLRNVVKQNPDKIKAGVEKAGDLIDKQTGGKYAEKVDAVQQKVGGFVDKQSTGETPSQAGPESEPTPAPESAETAPGSTPGAPAESPASATEAESGEPTADRTDAASDSTDTPAAEGSQTGRPTN
jgi:hypothetical protein